LRDLVRIASRVPQFIIINARKSVYIPFATSVYILNHFCLAHTAAIKKVRDASLKCKYRPRLGLHARNF